MEPLRVLCVFSTLDRGGAESMAMSLFRHMDREKVIFDFVKHTNKRGAFEDEIEELGGKIFTAPRYKIYNHFQYIHWWKHFLREHTEYKIIHGHYFTISCVYFKIAHNEGRITIGHSHCTKAPKDQVARPIANCIGNIMIGQIERNADYCMACSVDAGKWVFKKKRFEVLNNAIDADKFCSNSKVGSDVRDEFKLGDSLVIGNVSRFNLQKNPHGTLDIFKLVHDRIPNAKLLWVGEGPLRAEVQSKAKQYGIDKDVIFTGVRNDVDRLLQAIDVFVFFFFYEGLGIAAVESQAAGVDTYCSDAIPKDVNITNLCHFYPLNDLSKWANSICRIEPAHVHPVMTDQIKKAGYDIRETANWLQNFYLSIA